MKPSKQFLSLLMFFLLKANHTKNANVQLPCYNKSASVYITLSVWMSDKVTLRHGKGTFKMMRLDQKFHRWHTQHILKQQTHLKPLEKPNLLQHRKLFFWTIQRVSKSCEKKKRLLDFSLAKLGLDSVSFLSQVVGVATLQCRHVNITFSLEQCASPFPHSRNV